MMNELRLGDVLDDYCVKCRRLTNHAIVSLVNGEAAKVRCRTCYHDHDYRHEIAPPTKKELKQAEMLAAMLANGGVPEGDADTAELPDVEEGAIATESEAPDEAAEETPAPQKKSARKAKS